HLVKHVARRSVLLDLGPRRAAHERQDDQNHRGRGGPYDLEARIAFDILRLAAWTGAVSNQEDHKRYHHRDPDHQHDPEDQLEQKIDLRTEGRDIVRKIHVLEHRSLTSALATCKSRTSVSRAKEGG